MVYYMYYVMAGPINSHSMTDSFIFSLRPVMYFVILTVQAYLLSPINPYTVKCYVR